jgi:hypothetical protein
VTRSESIAVGKLAPATLLHEITEKLRRIGHCVTFFEDSNAFHYDNASLADADVAIVAPSFSCTSSVAWNRLSRHRN